MKHIKYILPALCCVCCCITATLTSCDDMLDMGNDDVLYADHNHLTSANDTVNSFVGILAQLQKVAVRTNLFGELRGDLTKVNDNANANIKAIAAFNVDDDNIYNNPRDYYAIINNCNYYIANADTALREYRYSDGAMSDFYVFRAEYVAVRAIRAWVYLQLGQIYGENIPLITEPILKLEEADEALTSAKRTDLAGICRYFIDDLKPYVPWFDYPYHGNPGYFGYNSSMPSRMSVLPISLVLGDLYLWLASINQDPLLAREAAKSYYDYIDWTPTINDNQGYKIKNVTGYYGDAWNTSSYASGNYERFDSYEGIWFSTKGATSFGRSNSEVIAAIAMDSASAEGHFNDLRYLYNYNHDDREIAASLSPSQPCIDYSDSQVFYDYYTSGGTRTFVTVPASLLTQEQISQHLIGDMRLGANFAIDQTGEYSLQTINKAYNPQDVIIYRTGDVYLRLAEALNFAGFPRFALAILRTGVDDNVIRYDILPQCTTAADSAFVSYFEFSDIYYRTRVSGYQYSSLTGGSFIINYDRATDRLTDDFRINQIGLHSRGSGYSIENPYYYPASADVPADSTGFPVQPPTFYNEVNPSTVAANRLEEFLTNNAETVELAQERGYVIPNLDDYANNRERLAAIDTFVVNIRDFSFLLWNEFYDARTIWYRDYAVPQVKARQLVVVDSLLDIESALETPFEGFRFGELMREAYRKGDPSILAQRVGRRDPSLVAILNDRRNWFISWKGQIGK